MPPKVRTIGMKDAQGHRWQHKRCSGSLLVIQEAPKSSRVAQRVLTVIAGSKRYPVIATGMNDAKGLRWQQTGGCSVSYKGPP